MKSISLQYFFIISSSPFYAFRLASNAFADIRSVGGIVKKSHKKSRNRRPGTPASLLWSLETTRHDPKINMAEKLVDVVVKLTQRGKKISINETLCCTRLMFFRLRELYKVKVV